MQQVLDPFVARAYSSLSHLEAALRLALTCKAARIPFAESPAVELIKRGSIAQHYSMTNRDLCVQVPAYMHARYKDGKARVTVEYSGNTHTLTYDTPGEFERAWEHDSEK